jgi:hypothetical protein
MGNSQRSFKKERGLNSLPYLKNPSCKVAIAG